MSILRRIRRDTVTRARLKCLLFFLDLVELEFSRQIFEKQISDFMKIRPVGAELVHASGQLDG